MKKYLLSLILCLSCTIVSASELSVEKQNRIIENYMIATRQLSQSQSASLSDNNELSDLPHKCGMSAVRDFKFNYDKFDKDILKATGVQLAPRPVLSDSIISPLGKFMIHYTTTGSRAVYTQLPGGAMGYVDSVAKIMDEVYLHIIDSLGYPEPIHDSFYVEGGDERYDVYLVNLGENEYGLAYTDSIIITNDGTINTITATGFLELDNDYQSLSQYTNRPLDAVRVTAAHEFFHMVQFGIDASESEQISSVVFGPAWMEMTAVWMEEEVYDDINDYYIYIPIFFAEPWASIQQFEEFDSFHQYASCVFPIFLSEKFDKDIIKAIWTKCGEYGAGPHFLQATGEVIDSATLTIDTTYWACNTGSFPNCTDSSEVNSVDLYDTLYIDTVSESYESVFSEFALWNYFTGSRAHLAPEGIGYKEREAYSEFGGFSDDLNDIFPEIREEIAHSFTIPFNQNLLFNPHHNAAFYLTIKNTDHIIPTIDRYWVCNSGSFPNCTDSTEVLESGVYDTSYVDSINALRFILGVDGTFSNPWGLNIIYDYKFFYDSIDVDVLKIPGGAGLQLDIPEPSQYNSVTFVFTPASSNRHFYTGNQYGVAFGVINKIDSLLVIDSTTMHVGTPTDIFFPYPNPAVLNEMSGSTVNFKFQLPSDTTFLIESTQPDTFIVDIDLFETMMVIDIYNINGEIVQTITNTDSNTSLEFTSEWNLKNQAGNDVASGVYFAYARIFANDLDGELLMEKKTKIAVIR